MKKLKPGRVLLILILIALVTITFAYAGTVAGILATVLGLIVYGVVSFFDNFHPFGR